MIDILKAAINHNSPGKHMNPELCYEIWNSRLHHLGHFALTGIWNYRSSDNSTKEIMCWEVVMQQTIEQINDEIAYQSRARNAGIGDATRQMSKDLKLFLQKCKVIARLTWLSLTYLPKSICESLRFGEILRNRQILATIPRAAGRAPRSRLTMVHLARDLLRQASHLIPETVPLGSGSVTEEQGRWVLGWLAYSEALSVVSSEALTDVWNYLGLVLRLLAPEDPDEIARLARVTSRMQEAQARQTKLVEDYEKEVPEDDFLRGSRWEIDGAWRGMWWRRDIVRGLLATSIEARIDEDMAGGLKRIVMSDINTWMRNFN